VPAHPHLQSLHEALAEAGAWERDALERLADLPVDERIAAGVAWPACTIEEVRWASRDALRLTLRAPPGVTLHDGISPGDRVDVETARGRLQGRVDDADARWAEVRVRGDVEPDQRAVVTLRFDPTTWRRYADALARADGHRSELRDVLLGERAPGHPSSHPPPLLDDRLNASQREAAEHALACAELALIHGPPGTGKTQVMVALLRSLVPHERPWALADSNAAVDHLVGRAVEAGLDVVRVGAWGRMSAIGREYALKQRVERGPYGEALRVMDRDLSRLVGRDDRESRSAYGRLLGERRDLITRAEDAALASAQVIATTLGTLAWRAPHLPRPTTALVDEATQALEPAIWTVVPYVERLFLLGDPHQLGPVVRAPSSPLERSMLARLVEPGATALPMPMLATQHRMHRDIQALVEPVYGDTYEPHPAVAEHRLADLPGVAETPLTTRATLWIDTAGAEADEELDPATRSTFNGLEVEVVAAVVQQLREAGVPSGLIGVITPYNAQVRELKEALPSGVEAATVNAFQGQEREVIVCSWVRSNPDGDLGFVADRRRLTVALTRARRLLVCVGDSATLGGDAAFSEVLDLLHEQDAVQSVWEPPWSEVLE